MAATETRTRPLVPPTPNPRRAPIPTELAALRDVLLAPEQAALKAMQDRLSDPATRAADIAESLPAALAIASADAAELVEHLRPLIREALGETLRERPDLLARGCGHALSHAMRHPFRAVGRTAGRFFRRRRRKVVDPRIEQLYLVRRSDGTLIEHTERGPMPGDDILDDDVQADLRSMRSMATYFLATLRDPELLSRYALLKQLRIERFTYGIHANEKYLLLSVIASGAEMPVELLEECDRLLAAASAPEAVAPFLPKLAELAGEAQTQ